MNNWVKLCLAGNNIVAALRKRSNSYVLRNTLDLLEWLVQRVPITNIGKSALLDQIAPLEMELRDIASSIDDDRLRKDILISANNLDDAIDRCKGLNA